MAKPCLPDTFFVAHRRVKWGECDPAGVVYTPRFSDYVVEAVNDFFEQMLGAPLQKALVDLDLGIPAKALQLVFRKSLWPEDRFVLSVSVADIRSRSFDLIVRAVDTGGEELFTAVFSGICIYHGRRESRSIPQILRQGLESYSQRFPSGSHAVVIDENKETGKTAVTEGSDS